PKPAVRRYLEGGLGPAEGAREGRNAAGRDELRRGRAARWHARHARDRLIDAGDGAADHRWPREAEHQCSGRAASGRTCGETARDGRRREERGRGDREIGRVEPRLQRPRWNGRSEAAASTITSAAGGGQGERRSGEQVER